jgi:hypothetical protein
MIVSSFPTTANGKLDRNALPDPPAMAAAADASLPVARLLLLYSISVYIFCAAVTVSPAVASPSSSSDASGAPVQYLSGLEEHVCRSVEQLRGRRPLPTASFATMGVDSLGAVLFLRLLCDSLGPGVKISPHSLYGQGNDDASVQSSLLPLSRCHHPLLLRGAEGAACEGEARGAATYRTQRGGDLER